jgi:hypothetical protein
MKALKLFAAAAVVSLAAAQCASSYGTGGRSASAPNPMLNFSSMVSGIFRGSTPGNALTLDIQNTGFVAATNSFNLFMTASGRYQGTNVRDVGVLHVENKGQNVDITYIPHFDPTVSGLSPEATRFTPEELNSACNFVLAPRGDGYAGETVGSTSCVRAIHGVTGKWTIEVEPGAIRLRNVDSGETLRFQRASR